VTSEHPNTEQILSIFSDLAFHLLSQGIPMHVVYYVTGHGFGHGVRTVAICNAFSPAVRITFRTSLPERFFKEEVRRDFCYAPVEFDCGCIQKDSLTTDVERTFACYQDLALKNELLLAEEAAWCRSQGADVMVSDITPFAFDVAAAIGIPSVAVTNFTWYDVYSLYLDRNPSFAPVLADMRSQYARASLLLALEPALPMAYFPHRLEVPPVGRSGQYRREEILTSYGFDPGKKIGLIYFGHFGLDAVNWDRLVTFTGWEFLGVFPLPSPPANYHLIPKTDFPYQDLAASADLMICKIGYGVTAECMLHGTPLLYLPRDDFAESPRLESALTAWGGGYRLSYNEFKEFGWGKILENISRQGRAKIVVPDGASLCAREIEKIGRG
jgi:hypothetical protein